MPFVPDKPSSGRFVPDQPTAGSSGEPPDQYGFLGNLIGGIAEPIAAMGSAAIAKPVGEIAGLAGLAREAFPGAPKGDPQAFSQDVRRSLTYEPKTPAGKSGANPLNFIPQMIGQGIGAIGRGAGELVAPPGSSPTREAVGRGVTEATEQGIGLAGAKAGKAAPAVGESMKELGRGQMQNALKPVLPQQLTGKAKRGIETLLEEGINVTKGGAQKLQDRVALINQKISALIENSPALVDKVEATQHVQGKIKQFMKQVDPLDDVAAIQSAYERFMKHPLLPEFKPAHQVESKILDERGRPFVTDVPASGTTKFPVQLAQEIKQGTHRQLGDKAYGELKSAEVEAQKTLNRGVKDVIAAAVPEVRPLNAVESNYLNALNLVERRVMMAANKNPIGLGWLTTNPVKFAGWMADRSELFKSLIARMLYTGGKMAPPMGAAGPPLGAMLPAQANQLQAPPQ